MARKKTATTEDTTALAVVDEAAALAELSDFFDDPDMPDGLEDVGGEDVKLAVLLWNMRGLDPDGKSYPRDVFFDTVSEQVVDEVEAVFLLSTKTKRWDSFDNDLDKTIVHCESPDRVTGKMKDGTTRPCNGCPDDGWFTNAEGKASRKCGDVHNVVAVNRLTQKPFMVRYKKTALKPFRNHVMAHHWGGRPVTDPKTGRTSRRNVPLFCYAVRLTLKMHESGKYALPVIEPIVQSRDAHDRPSYLLPIPEVRDFGESAKAYVEIMGAVMEAADKQTAKHAASTDGGDDGLSGDDFAD